MGPLGKPGKRTRWARGTAKNSYLLSFVYFVSFDFFGFPRPSALPSHRRVFRFPRETKNRLNDGPFVRRDSTDVEGEFATWHPGRVGKPAPLPMTLLNRALFVKTTLREASSPLCVLLREHRFDRQSYLRSRTRVFHFADTRPIPPGRRGVSSVEIRRGAKRRVAGRRGKRRGGSLA